MNSKLSFLLIPLIVAGCNFQQDPLSGAPDSVRNGVPPNKEKPVEEKILDKNALQIDAPNLINGRVGAEIDFKILGRVMTPGMDFKMTIDNLSDFPGATFDSATGQFKWTPLKSMMNGFASIELSMRVTMVTVANSDNPTVSMERKSIALVIVNQYSKPIVNSIGGAAKVVAGSTYRFPIEFEDLDAVTANDVNVDIRDCQATSAKSISHLVSVGRIQADANVKNKYKGDVGLDLSKGDVLPTGDYCFGVMAVSKFGVVSEIYSKELRIEAKMKTPRTTAERLYEAVVGDKLRFSFSIFDPSGEGNVSILQMDEIANIFPGSTLTCSKSTFVSYQVDCVAVLDLTNVKPANYVIKIQAENAAKSTSQKAMADLPLRIQVKAATP